ncbi:MAG: LLM class flavin-dependent oxidoreductase, partial [bacterium]
LWTGEHVTYHGEHFSLEDVSFGFRPHQRPGIPILLASHSGKGTDPQYRRAARLANGMIAITDSPQEFGRVREQVLREVLALGGNPHRFPAVYYMTVNLNRNVEAARQEATAWITRYYGADYWGERWGPYGTPAAVADRIRQYADAGAEEVIIRFASHDQVGQLDLLAREVLPALK